MPTALMPTIPIAGVSPHAFQEAVAGWILALCFLVLMLITQGTTLALAVIAARSRIKAAEDAAKAAEAQKKASDEHSVEIAETKAAIITINKSLPQPVLPQSWGEPMVVS